MKNESISEAGLSQAEVPAFYDKLSRVYDLWGAVTEGRARERGLELAAIRDGEALLDAGAGTGMLLYDAAVKNPHGMNAGIDVSAGMLDKARSRLKRLSWPVELKQASVLEIPYPDATFDLLFNSYMFDLMPAQAMPAVLAEFRRVLKPKGRLVLINMTIGERPGSQVFEWLYRISPKLMGGCRGVLLEKPVLQADFHIVRREYIQQALFPSEVILAIK